MWLPNSAWGHGFFCTPLGSRNPCPAHAVLALAQGSVFHNCKPALLEYYNPISDGTQICPGPALVDLKDLVPSPKGFCHPAGRGSGSRE